MRVEAGFRLKSNTLCVIQVEKQAEMVSLSVVSNLGNPLRSRVAPVHPLDATFVSSVKTSVFLVLLIRSFSQVEPRIVQRVSVFVVHLICWPRTSHVEPSQSRSREVAIVDRDDPPPAFTSSCAVPDPDLFSRGDVREYASQRVVAHQFPKTLNRERIFGSHAASFRQRWGVIRTTVAFPRFGGSLILTQ